MGKYTQVFTLEYQVDPEQTWSALQKAVDDMDGAKLGSVDDNSKKLEFSTGVGSTSWGQEVAARVESGAQGGSQIHVRGKPKGTFLATKWGEKLHTSSIKRHLSIGIETALRGQ
jgi:hypothetical protein